MVAESIIEGCRKGDRKCQNSLVQMLAPRLLALCMRYCRDEEEAKDALQDTFISAFKYLYSFHKNADFEPWIRKIAVRQCLALIRKREDFDYVEDQKLEWSGGTEMPDVYAKLECNEIMSLLEKLPRSLFLVFNLAVVEGMNHSEIADLLGIAESTSRANLVRARLKMQELIKIHYGASWDIKEKKTA